MRNIETLTTKTGPDDAGLNILLTEARLEERRARAEAMAARLDSLACHITSRQLAAAPFRACNAASPVRKSQS